MKASFTLAFFCVFTRLVLPLHAAPPGIINHQGRIAVAGVNHDGAGYFKFAFVDDGATETYWTNDGTKTGSPGGEPTNAVPITVSKGHFALGLGDSTLANMTAVPVSVFADNSDVRLRVWFATAPGGPFELLSPDKRIASAAYALNGNSPWATKNGDIYHDTGNVGVGTATPGAGFNTVFDVAGSASFRHGGDTDKGIKIDTIGSRHRIYSDATSGTPYDLMFGTYPNGHIDQLVLHQATGNVGIGTSSPSGKLHVVGTAGNNTGVWSNFSDRRLKENIAPLEDGSLKRLLRLEGVSYDYTREDLRKGYDHTHRGWVAQEVEKVFPEWVSEAPDGMKMITPVGFNALAVEALRELREEKDAEIDELKGRVEALEALVLKLAAEIE